MYFLVAHYKLIKTIFKNFIAKNEKIDCFYFPLPFPPLAALVVVVFLVVVFVVIPFGVVDGFVVAGLGVLALEEFEFGKGVVSVEAVVFDVVDVRDVAEVGVLAVVLLRLSSSPFFRRRGTGAKLLAEFAVSGSVSPLSAAKVVMERNPTTKRIVQTAS